MLFSIVIKANIDYITNTSQIDILRYKDLKYPFYQFQTIFYQVPFVWKQVTPKLFLLDLSIKCNQTEFSLAKEKDNLPTWDPTKNILPEKTITSDDQIARAF